MPKNPNQLSLSPGKKRVPVEGMDFFYRRIQADMRARIATGDWAPGQALPNRVQLCDEFGTTRITLDKAIQGLVAEGLLRSTKRIGTFVTGQAEKTSIQETQAPTVVARPVLQTLRMGIVVERNSAPPSDAMTFGDNFYFGPLFQSIRDTVSGQPIDTVFAHLHRSEYLQFFQDAVLDGMVLIAPSLQELPMLHHLMQAKVPFVAVGISSRDLLDTAIPCQDTDNRQGARDAIRHLVELGHQQIAVINLATAVANHHDRMEGCLQAFAAVGLTVTPGNIVQMHQYDFARFESRIEQWMTQALAEDTLPTAIFACDYSMTLATLRVLRHHGLRVPEDVSVVGFDDPLSAEHLTPPLTTVRQPVYKIGRRAAERLLAAVQNGAYPYGSELLATELIVRKSTCPPRKSLSIKGEG